MGHAAAPVNQNADLAADLSRDFRELPRKFVAEEDVRVETPAEEALELLDLACFQTACAAVDLDGGLLGTKRVRLSIEKLASPGESCTWPLRPRGASCAPSQIGRGTTRKGAVAQEKSVISFAICGA